MAQRLNINKLFFFHGTELALLLGLTGLFPAQSFGGESVYEQQVMLARSGNYQPLLDSLKRQQMQGALSDEQVADWLQVASWAGRDEDVVSVWQRYQQRVSIPARGIASAARSYRNLRRWTESLALWEQVLCLAPANIDYRIGRIKTLADGHQEWPALFEAQRLVALAPEDLAALHTLADALSVNRMSAPALALADRANLTPAERRRLEIDAASELVRIADILPREEKERFAVAQQALDRYDMLFALWRNDPQAARDLVRARIDRLGALYAHNYYPLVTAEYESLASQKADVPGWALRWVVDAYLAQRKLEPAVALSPQAARPLPDESEHAMFYALLDSGQYLAARRYVENITGSAPYVFYIAGSPTPQPNDAWLEGKTLSLQYLLATHALPEAEKLAYHLATTGPGNQGLRIGYAEALQMRGLPQAAERELKAAEVLEPSNLELERQQAYVAQDLHEWRQMSLLTDDVLTRAPLDLDSRQLSRARDVHRMSELRISGNQGITSDTPISGAHDFSWDAAIYGPPLADEWRLFGGNRFSSGRFEEGKGLNRSVFGGIEWRPRASWAEFELANNHFNGGNKPGARLAAWHSFSDSWRAGGGIERLARGTPLRALRNGISSNQANIWLRWYQNERREYRLAATASRFTDHNFRQEYSLEGKERVWQRPGLTLDLLPGFSFGANSRANTVYYSPKWDFSAAPTFSADHVMYRRYDTVWSQQFTTSAGFYRQKSYGSGVITSFGYGQRIEWNNVLDTGVMLNWEKRPYDGRRESNLAVAFDANLRF